MPEHVMLLAQAMENGNGKLGSEEAPTPPMNGGGLERTASRGWFGRKHKLWDAPDLQEV